MDDANEVFMETRIDEIAEGIFRLSTFVPDIAPPARFHVQPVPYTGRKSLAVPHRFAANVSPAPGDISILRRHAPGLGEFMLRLAVNDIESALYGSLGGPPIHSPQAFHNGASPG